MGLGGAIISTIISALCLWGGIALVTSGELFFIILGGLVCLIAGACTIMSAIWLLLNLLSGVPAVGGFLAKRKRPSKGSSKSSSGSRPFRAPPQPSSSSYDDDDDSQYTEAEVRNAATPFCNYTNVGLTQVKINNIRVTAQGGDMYDIDVSFSATDYGDAGFAANAQAGANELLNDIRSGLDRLGVDYSINYHF